jgi:malonyl-CoA/methylmalonyl-CoA synthetase
MSRNLFAAMRAARPAAGKPFLTLQDGRAVRYGELEALSGRCANALVACGVETGDRVAVQVEKSPEQVLLYLACMRLGAVYLPLNPAYTPAEILYFLRDAQPSLFVCTPAALAALRPVAAEAGVPRVETLDQDGTGSFVDLAAARPEEFADREIGTDHLASILYTSGTTGLAKGAMLTHGNLLSNAEALVATWGITSADTLIHALPIFHTHGLFVALNTSLLSGASILFHLRFDLDAILDAMPQATTLMGVPTFYTRLLSSPRLIREAVAHMRLFVSGSAPLSAETHAEFLARTGHAILERYGMTETNMIASNPLAGDRRPGSVGRPLPGVEVRIADPSDGRVLPQGEVGGIEVRGPNVFVGYWRNPEKTKAEFRSDGFFITGDMGRIDADGYVWIVGRSKDLIISGGFNIYPAEVEAALDALPGVAECAVIGVPHPDLGEGVTAIIIPRPGAALDEAAMRKELAKTLARYKIPRRLIQAETLPRNVMGKIQKNALREAFAGIYTAKH